MGTSRITPKDLELQRANLKKTAQIEDEKKRAQAELDKQKREREALHAEIQKRRAAMRLDEDLEEENESTQTNTISTPTQTENAKKVSVKDLIEEFKDKTHPYGDGGHFAGVNAINRPVMPTVASAAARKESTPTVKPVVQQSSSINHEPSSVAAPAPKPQANRLPEISAAQQLPKQAAERIPANMNEKPGQSLDQFMLIMHMRAYSLELTIEMNRFVIREVSRELLIQITGDNKKGYQMSFAYAEQINTLAYKQNNFFQPVTAQQAIKQLQQAKEDFAPAFPRLTPFGRA